ncbi:MULTISPECIES: restriction endonuclease subunit S [Photorhabdus]|uniref:Type I restriction modification DNA specificity domain-containing protein n=1 Tax=Photorhabdus thracensis TaxID=230089 RepID=A0A0F7LPH2_9GAMM|nr:restriction endonuclease subunit S [Photorhabdus thracensis]AKH63741.1 hypothetical protein VY86_10750 [Photorhabdus thracensis]MCC8420174.1 restriction endonuclease subunit S [Photorhabdus thracensis]
MTKYRAYPEYKDSGIEWLGDVPINWNVIRLKFLCKTTTGDKDTIHKTELGKYPFFVRSETVEKINTYSFDGEAVLTAGDGAIGKIFHYINGKFDFHQRVYKFSNFKKINGDFFYFYISNNLAHEVVKLSAKTTVDSLRLPMLENFVFSFPDYSTQRIIVKFLKEETTKIDQLIAQQMQLIELLKEKRQAVISHTVTKGLNPDAKMKNSGVEWLGEIPEHWEITPLRYLGTCQNGINIGAEFFGSGHPFVSYGDVYNHRILPYEVHGKVQSTIRDRENYSVQRGDVFFTRTSETVEEIGFSSTCLSTIQHATFAGFLIRLRPLQEIIEPEFSMFYFSNSLLRIFFVKEMNLVTRASLSQDLLKALPVILPPAEEQKEIASFLDKKVKIFQQLIKNADIAIHLLKERRSALISAAVTGKIDVRDWQPPKDAV